MGTITYIKNELEWLKHKDIQIDPSFQDLANLTINRCIENINMLLEVNKEFQEIDNPKQRIEFHAIPRKLSGKPLIMREMKPMMVDGRKVDTMIKKDAMKKPSEYKYTYDLEFRKKIKIEIINAKYYVKYAKLYTDIKIHPKFIQRCEIKGIPYIAKIYKMNIIIYGFKKEENGKRSVYLIGSKKLGDYLK